MFGLPTPIGTKKRRIFGKKNCPRLLLYYIRTSENCPNTYNVPVFPSVIAFISSKEPAPFFP